jgi:Lysozyme like domain
MILSISQLQNYLQQAGWPDSLIPTAAAVFMFESGGGNTDAHNPGHPLGAEDSWGLAQINRKAWSQWSVEQLRDPLFNLTKAYNPIFRQQGWNAWSNTYNGGRYLQYMAQSNAAWNNRTSNSFAPVSQIADDASGLNLPTEGWIGIFIFGLGAILFLSSLSD